MWGYPIENAVVYWGARAIYQDYCGGHIDLLPDRQSFECPADKEQAKPFLKWLDKVALPWLRKIVKKERPAVSSERVFELVEGAFVLRASCRASYGYMYIGAAQLAAQPQEVPHGG